MKDSVISPVRSQSSVIALTVFSSAADAQLRFQKVAILGSPNENGGPIAGGRDVEFSSDKKKDDRCVLRFDRPTIRSQKESATL
jgi:hypothetical protein